MPVATSLPDGRAGIWRNLRASSLASGSAVYLISNLLNAAIPFALLPILTRHLAPNEYGAVAVFQTLAATLTALLGLEVAGAAGIRYYHGQGGAQESTSFIGSAFVLVACTSSAAILIGILFWSRISPLLGLDPSFFLAAVVMSGASVVYLMRLSQWQIRKQARCYGAMQVSQSMLNMCLSLLLVVGFGWGAAGRVGAQVASTVCFAVVSFMLLRRDQLVRLSGAKTEHIREALSFGIPLLPHTLGAVLLLMVDRFVINLELGLAQAGIFMVALQLASVMGFVFDAVNKAFAPWLLERLAKADSALKRQIVRVTYAWFAAIFVAVAAFFVLGPAVITGLAGTKYRAAGAVIGWLALGSGFSGMYLMVTNYIFFAKRTGLLSMATAATGLLYIGTLPIFIRAYGIEGAGIAFAIATGTRFVATWLISNHCYRMPWFSLGRT